MVCTKRIRQTTPIHLNVQTTGIVKQELIDPQFISQQRKNNVAIKHYETLDILFFFAWSSQALSRTLLLTVLLTLIQLLGARHIQRAIM